jgi:hypothetical protein
VASCRFFSVALVLALGLTPLAPPEHVHETLDQGHHHVLVHRHGQAHAGEHHSPNANHGVFDDDDGPVLVLSTPYTVPHAFVRVIADPASEYRVMAPLAMERVQGRVNFVEPLIHGPPRAPASLRAPPSSLAL